MPDVNELVVERPTDAPKDWIDSIGGQLPHLPIGDRAALRRLFLTKSRTAEGVVIGLLMKAGVTDAAWRGPTAFARWRLIAHVAAVLSGTAAIMPHAPGARLGRALYSAGYSSIRLMRLTTARGPALVDQIVRAARFLAQAGQVPIDLRTIRDLASDDPATVETARLRIAQDYYAAAHSNKKDSQ